MGICKFCGKDAGWFKEQHAECAQLAETGYQQILAAVRQAVAQGTSFAEAKTSIDIAIMLDRVPADRVHQAFLQAWSDAAEEIGMAEPLSADKYAAMVQFSQDAGLDAAELAKSSGSITASVSAVLWRVMHGDLKEIPAIAHPFNLSGSEVALFLIDGVIYAKDTVSRTYQTDYSGMSVNLGYGVYHRFGTSERTEVDHTSLTEVDRGQMLFTTNNIYFGGAHKSVKVSYEHIVQFRFYGNGLGIFRDSANAVVEVFQVMNPWGQACGRFMFNLAHFLAQPEAKALYGAATGKRAHRQPDTLPATQP